MIPRLLSLGAVAVLLASWWVGTTGPVRAQGPDVGTEAQRESGKNLYLKYCSQCHGDKGDAAGYATPHLMPRPRDFTTGKFKVRTTPSGALPSHQDLVNIIRLGMPYTSMPAWPDVVRPGSVGSRVLPDDLLRGLLEPRNGSQAHGVPERAELHERIHRARKEALRGDRLFEVPR